MAYRGWLALLAFALLLAVLAPHAQGAGGSLYLPCIVAPDGSNGAPLTATPRPATKTPMPTATHTPRPVASATPTVEASATPIRTATRTATATGTPTHTSTLTPTPPSTGTPTVEQLLLNGDFEQGAVYWEQASNGVGVELIQEGVGRWGSWGAELGGRFYAEDGIRQAVYIPADAQLAFVGFSVKMTTLESASEVRSVLGGGLTHSDGSVLCWLGFYDNTDTAYIWNRLYSPDLTTYRGQTIWVAAAAATEGLTTFYLDDFTFLVERTGG